MAALSYCTLECSCGAYLVVRIDAEMAILIISSLFMVMDKIMTYDALQFSVRQQHT